MPRGRSGTAIQHTHHDHLQHPCAREIRLLRFCNDDVQPGTRTRKCIHIVGLYDMYTPEDGMLFMPYVSCNRLVV